MKTPRLLFACAPLLLLTGEPAWAYRPSLKWKTRRSAHFSVHYDEKLAPQVGPIADLCEEAFRQLTRELGWTPRGRTQVVLVDERDQSNGMTQVIPSNNITLFLPAPSPESALGNTDDWLRLLIFHELTHVIHLDMARGLPQVLRRIFGRAPFGFLPLVPSTFPNQNAPAWMVEGYATCMETLYSSTGRGRSSNTDMLLRADLLEKRFRSLGQMTDWQTSWPAGSIRYLYGESFLRFIFDEIGPEAPRRLAEVHSRMPLPAFQFSRGVRSFGKNYRDLYARWKESLNKKYTEQIKQVSQRPLSEGVPLTQTGSFKTGLCFSPDGKWIAYAAANEDGPPGIHLIDRATGADRLVAEAWAHGRLDWSPDSQEIVFSKMEYRGAYQLRNDLFVYSLKTGRTRRGTRGERARDPAWKPDGAEWAYVRLKTNGEEVVVQNLNTTSPRVILDGAGTSRWSHPAWSPDGKTLAFSRWKNGQQDIVLDRIEENRLDLLTNDRAMDLSPAWSPDGQTLYFSSDRTGIYNLFAFSLTTGKIVQVTHVLGGAFFPAPTPDGKAVAYLSYSSRGLDLRLLTLANALNLPAAPFQNPYPPLFPAPPPEPTEPEKPYSPLGPLLPRFWFPNFQGGIFTAGLDALHENAYALSTYNGPDYEVSWTNQNFYPVLTVHTFNLSRRAPLFGRGYTVDGRVPLPKMFSGQSISMGLEKRTLDLDRARRDGRDLPRPPPPHWNGLTAGWAYSNAHVYGFSVAPESGRDLSLEGFRQIRRTENSPLFSTLRLCWNEYFPGWGRHHALAIAMSGGVGNAPVFDTEEGDTPLAISVAMTRTLVEKKFAAEPLVPPRAMTPGVLPGLQRSDHGFFKSYSEMSLSYFFPIAYLEKAPGSGFVYLDRIYGHLFGAADQFWNSQQDHGPTRSYMGAEATAWCALAYDFPLSLKASVQKELSNGKPLVSKVFFTLFWQ